MYVENKVMSTEATAVADPPFSATRTQPVNNTAPMTMSIMAGNR